MRDPPIVDNLHLNKAVFACPIVIAPRYLYVLSRGVSQLRDPLRPSSIDKCFTLTVVLIQAHNSGYFLEVE